MIELVETIVKAIVDEPDAVNVTEKEEDGLVTLELNVAPNDMGKVIGKQGRIARAIRTVVKAMATKKGIRAELEII
ncbi:MAG: KH domain-containing protein [Firmicutes bacterium]|nr:KH domain-containing protein [Bacillota bacterium]